MFEFGVGFVALNSIKRLRMRMGFRVRLILTMSVKLAWSLKFDLFQRSIARVRLGSWLVLI